MAIFIKKDIVIKNNQTRLRLEMGVSKELCKKEPSRQVWQKIPYNVSPYFTIVQIIFHFLWDHWADCGIFENGVLLLYTLEDVSSVANFITAYEESQ